ncbi:hypothetical protein CDAR_495301 [Caerostris darwini]|uniref:Uncharacterized protein n=1 Tax=Caerostris darwini TaxID=1538125 RepID=A0AAV4UWQ9_9ARAC|nr:hypothetical protein CDAR_495301 [Caerostris darwini]
MVRGDLDAVCCRLQRKSPTSTWLIRHLSYSPHETTFVPWMLSLLSSQRFKRDSGGFLGAFLSGEVEGEFNRFSNTWTVARVASRRLGITWSFEDSSPSISFADLTLNARGRFFSLSVTVSETPGPQPCFEKRNRGNLWKLSASLLPTLTSFPMGLTLDSLIGILFTVPA